MVPCGECHRHLRDADRVCPFCGATQHAVAPPSAAVSGIGAFALVVVAMFGSACAKDSVAVDVGEESGESESMTAETTADESGSESTESTGTDTDDSTSNTSFTSGSFYAGPDVDWTPVSSCDPFAQDCPEGEKCVPYGSTGGNWDANKCVPVLGDGQPGDPCTYGGLVEATDDCGADSHCWDVMDVDGMPVGVCTPFCEGTPDDPICPVDMGCLIANDGSITLCLGNCDPLLQDCSEGLACFWAQTNFFCVFTTQDIPEGEPCGFVNDCVAGQFCADAATQPNCNGAACCTSFCELTDLEACPDPERECVPFFEEGTELPGYENVGVCAIPGG